MLASWSALLGLSLVEAILTSVVCAIALGAMVVVRGMGWVVSFFAGSEDER